MEEWSHEVIDFLELIRRKSVSLAQKHTASFFFYKSCMNAFDVPTIILSVLSSSFSVGTTAFISQANISITTCSISMLIAILGSIKLYLNLTTNTANELMVSKEFHILALDISKMLFIPIDLRKVKQEDFMDEIYDRYIVLLQKSSLVRAEEERSQLDCQIDKLKTSPKSPFNLQNRIKNPLTIITN
jgi:hypothetical protein